MRLFTKTGVALAVFVAMLMLGETGWSQCAMCRTALQNSPEGQAVAQGFRYGIVFLLATPYAILGSIAIGLVRGFWRKDDEGES